MERRRITGKQAAPQERRSRGKPIARRITGKQSAPEIVPEKLNTIQSVFEELDRPGIERLKQALRSRGIPFKDQELREVVRGSEQKQLFAPRQRYEGKITSSNINDRWAADLIDFTAQPSPPYTHILVVQDIFSRKIHARVLRGTTPQETAAAFRNIVAASAPPKELSTDAGAEFNTAPFPGLLAEKNIAHQVKLPQDRNGIATLDRAIQSLKVALASEKGPWTETLAKVVRGQNADPTSHLYGSTPDSVAGNNVLQFRLKEQAADDRDHNTDINDKRAAQLKRDGAYRV